MGGGAKSFFSAEYTRQGRVNSKDRAIWIFHCHHELVLGGWLQFRYAARAILLGRIEYQQSIII